MSTRKKTENDTPISDLPLPLSSALCPVLSYSPATLPTTRGRSYLSPNRDAARLSRGVFCEARRQLLRRTDKDLFAPLADGPFVIIAISVHDPEACFGKHRFHL